MIGIETENENLFLRDLCVLCGEGFSTGLLEFVLRLRVLVAKQTLAAQS